MEAQRFPEDFDGLMPSAPNADYTGRNTIAAAWFAKAFSDGHGGSVLDDTAAQIVHKSVLQHCGAQAGVDEGLVTDPPSCKWQPEIIACHADSNDSDCLTPRQVQAVKGLMSPATNSKGVLLLRISLHSRNGNAVGRLELLWQTESPIAAADRPTWICRRNMLGIWRTKK